MLWLFGKDKIVAEGFLLHSGKMDIIEVLNAWWQDDGTWDHVTNLDKMIIEEFIVCGSDKIGRWEVTNSFWQDQGSRFYST